MITTQGLYKEYWPIYQNFFLSLILVSVSAPKIHYQSGSSRRKIVNTWNCSQQGLLIILSNQVMISGKRHCCWVLLMFFFSALSTSSTVSPSFVIITLIKTTSADKYQYRLEEKFVFLILNCPFKVLCLQNIWKECILSWASHR